jgi:hypothetical protein
MKKYEYKTIDIKFDSAGILGHWKGPEFEETLNKEGTEGWRYVDTIVQTDSTGETSGMKLVLERELE